ncbi:polysaccharide deacetylase family protein [Streptomyces sp. KL116D]|uniref:polysaccharide deacetylase family protein n=1 Tax=Streptomyces sp. KL116D TaxID=3045152 RepID=UPI003557434A
MARHGEQRGWYGKLIGGGARRDTAATGAFGVDCAGRCRERVVASGEGPRLQRGVKRVAASIAHASDAGERGVNITIDDGPDPVWTPQVLDVLRSTGVKATFCMVGTQAQAHPDLVKKVVAAGHRLCDTPCRTTRPWTRSPSPTSRGRSCDAERMITKASGGVRPMYYRAPRRSRSPPTAVTSPPPRGMRPLGWNVDTKDFEQPGTDAIVATVQEELPNGPTLLFHDAGGDRTQTARGPAPAAPQLKQQGYSFGFPVR